MDFYFPAYCALNITASAFFMIALEYDLPVSDFVSEVILIECQKK